MIDKNQIFKEFALIPSGQKGWHSSNIVCPFCGAKEGHIYLIFGEGGKNAFNCRKCYKKGSINFLFSKIGRSDLVSKFYSSIQKDKLELKLNKEPFKQELDLSLPIKQIPLGFERIYSNDYLEKERGFIKEHFDNYIIGKTDKHFVLKQNYNIFLVIEDDECKGYVARSEKSKEWIKLYNKKLKERGLEGDYLRWRNSNSEFEKLLFGIDEIKKGITNTVIVVEGITSKANIDKLLNLFYIDEIKCICTFGKKISPTQIEKLKNKEIKKIILLYDPDAIQESKNYAIQIMEDFELVRVGYLKDKDPGDLSEEELKKIFENLENPINFMLTKIQKRDLNIKYEFKK